MLASGDGAGLVALHVHEHKARRTEALGEPVQGHCLHHPGTITAPAPRGAASSGVAPRPGLEERVPGTVGDRGLEDVHVRQACAREPPGDELAQSGVRPHRDHETVDVAHLGDRNAIIVPR